MKMTYYKKEKEPVVCITEKAYNYTMGLVNNCDIEIGWLALVHRKDNVFTIYDIEICKQKCTASHTELSEDALHEVYEKFKDKPDRLNDVRCWGHSHVNMSPTPSGQDDETFEEFAKNCDYFIRLIINKKEKYTLSLSDEKSGIIYEDLELHILNNKERKEIIDQLAKYEKLLDEHDKEQKEMYNKITKEVVKKYVVKDDVGKKNTSRDVIYPYVDNYYKYVDNYYETEPEYSSINDSSYWEDLIASVIQNLVDAGVDITIPISGRRYAIDEIYTADEILDIASCESRREVETILHGDPRINGYQKYSFQMMYELCKEIVAGADKLADEIMEVK